jgi:Uma2 family endonuclease
MYKTGKHEMSIKTSEQKLQMHEDWMKLKEGENAELIDGKLVMLATPTLEHQIVSGNIYMELREVYLGRNCRVIQAPYGLKLSETDNNIYEPDIFVVCGEYDVKKNYYTGIPDLIVEILSPTTGRYDKTKKFIKYINCGIKNIWIVNILGDEQLVNVFSDINKYEGIEYNKHDSIKLGSHTIELVKVFDY